MVVYDTAYITLHDTTYISVHDTIWLTQTDTLWLHDTIIIHDTIYISHEGIDNVDEINAKVYTNHCQIVVEGADGNQVILYDMKGRILASKQDEYVPLRFNVPNSGTYLIKIGNHSARKIVVIR